MLYEFIFEPAPRLRQHRRKVGFGSTADHMACPGAGPLYLRNRTKIGDPATSAQGQTLTFSSRCLLSGSAQQQQAAGDQHGHSGYPVNSEGHSSCSAASQNNRCIDKRDDCSGQDEPTEQVS